MNHDISKRRCSDLLLCISTGTTPTSSRTNSMASASLAGSTPMSYSTSSLGRMIAARKNTSLTQSSTNITATSMSPSQTSSPSAATVQPARSASALGGFSPASTLSASRHQVSTGSRTATVTPSRQSLSSTSSASSSQFDINATSTPRSAADAAGASTPRNQTSSSLTNGRVSRPVDLARVGTARMASTLTSSPRTVVDKGRVGARSPIAVERQAGTSFTGSSSQLQRKLSAASSSTTSSSRTSSPGPSRQNAQLGQTRLFNASSDMF